MQERRARKLTAEESAEIIEESHYDRMWDMLKDAEESDEDE